MVSFFNELLSMAFESSILIIAILAVRLIFRKIPKQFKKILWSLVGIKLLIPFSVKSTLSLIPKTPDIVANNAAVTADSVGEVSKTVTFFDFAPYIWLCVAILLGLYGLISFARLKHKICDAVRDSGNVYLSEKVDSPFVCGFIRPKIYLPFNLEDETKDYVLRHEKQHIKTGDHILKALAFILVCIYWFNPLVWVAYFLFCKDIELACDDAVIKNLTEAQRKNYAEALLNMGTNKINLSACPVAFGEVSIKERIFSVVNYKRVTKSAIFVCIALSVAITVCFMSEPVDTKVTKEELPKVESVVTEPTTEATTEPPTTEPVTEPATEPVTKPVTEPVTEPVETKSQVNSGKSYNYDEPEEETAPTIPDELKERFDNSRIRFPEESESDYVYDYGANERNLLSYNPETTKYDPYALPSIPNLFY